VELPGSILLENQGFPASAADEDTLIEATPIARPVSQSVRRSTHPSINNIEDGEDFLELLRQFPEPISYTKSAPDPNEDGSEMRSVRSSNALNASAMPKHKKFPSDSHRHSRHRLSTSTPRDDEVGTNVLLNAEESNATSTKTQSGAYKLLQPSAQNREGQDWKHGIQESGYRRSDVSYICFHNEVQLFVHRYLHNETVSQLLPPLPPAPFRHFVPEVNFFCAQASQRFNSLLCLNPS